MASASEQEQDSAAVGMAEDVRQGYVSIEAARDSCGVVIEKETGEVDQAGTDKLRN